MAFVGLLIDSFCWCCLFDNYLYFGGNLWWDCLGFVLLSWDCLLVERFLACFNCWLVLNKLGLGWVELGRLLDCFAVLFGVFGLLILELI